MTMAIPTMTVGPKGMTPPDPLAIGFSSTGDKVKLFKFLERWGLPCLPDDDRVKDLGCFEPS